MNKFRKKPVVIEAIQVKAKPGDWIIKGVAGEFYPCKPHIFKETYEPCEEGVES